MKKRLVILSLDALGDIDAKYFESLPGFKYLIDHGTYIRKVKSVYPSLTYPCHASILTGRYPDKHGVVNNLRLQPSKEKMDWYWYEKDIEGDTLIRAARRKNYKTAAVLWPVSAKGAIDYNIAEIFPHRPWHNQAYISFMNSSKGLLLDLEKKHGHLRDGLTQPQLDDFSEACFLDILKNKEPDMALCHFIAVDDKKHRHGTQAPEIVEAIGTYDKRIQNVLSYLQDSGDMDRTNLLVLSDHSHLDIRIGIRVNKYLDDKGYINKKKGKGVWKYKAIMQEAGGAAYIYTNKMDRRELDVLHEDLLQLVERLDGLERLLTKAEIKDKGADHHADFMLEAKEGYYFLQDLEGPLEDDTLPKHVATHGFDPEKENFQAVAFMVGPDFHHTSLEKASLVDIAPTIAKVMDFDLQGAQGRVLEEAIKRR